MRVVTQDNIRGAQRIGYRSDIDGLRAISVLAVVLFHTFPTVVRGGFVGVDVFFVISGFLITRIISKSIDEESFSIVWFYRQRILRIFPSLIIVLATAYAFGWMSLYADEFKRLALHIIGGATFTAALRQKDAAYAVALAESLLSADPIMGRAAVLAYDRAKAYAPDDDEGKMIEIVSKKK